MQMVQLLLLFVAMSVTDRFDEIRRHPYVSNAIEKIATMDPMDYLLTPAEMHAKLMRHVDVLDNKMRQVTQHPHFVSARGWLHSAIRNVRSTLSIRVIPITAVFIYTVFQKRVPHY